MCDHESMALEGVQYWGGQGKKQNVPFIFFFANVWQIIDPRNICTVKSDKQKKPQKNKDFITQSVSVTESIVSSNLPISYIFFNYFGRPRCPTSALQNIGAAKVSSTHALQIIAAPLPTPMMCDILF